MKKILAIISAAVLSLSLIAVTVGCGDNDVPEPIDDRNADTPVITRQPQNASLRKGEEARGLEITAYTNDNGSLSYQWYQNTADNNAGGTAVEGADQSVFGLDTSVTGTAYYYCVVINTNQSVGGEKTAAATSAVAAIRIYSETEGPRITSQPQSVDYIIGAQNEAIPLEVEAAVSRGSLAYQWYVSATGAYDDAAALPDATAPRYVPEIGVRGKSFYYCEVTNTDETASEAKTAVIRTKFAVISVDFDYAGFTFAQMGETEACKLTAYTGDSLNPVIPDTDEDGRAVAEIGAGAFRGTKIMSVTIPETVKKLGTLSKLNDGYGVAEDGVFYNCVSLQTIRFDGQLEVIGDSCFRGCKALETNVWDFCSGLKNIGKSSFEELNCLPEELIFPATLTSIDKYAFQSCPNVNKISFAGDEVTAIYGATFAKMNRLAEVVLPVSMTNVNDSFKDDKNLKSFTYLRSAAEHGGITENSSFKSANIQDYPDLVIYVPGDSYAAYATALGVFAAKIDTSELPPPPVSSDFVFAQIGDTDTCKLTAYTGDSLNPVIPDTDSEGRKVVEIGVGVFVDSLDTKNHAVGKPITEVTIPDTVTTLGVADGAEGGGRGNEANAVFGGCTALETIHFSGKFITVGNYAFSGCSALTTDIWQYCGETESIGIGAFQGLQCLPEDLVIPSSVKGEIYRYTFQNSAIKTLAFAGNGVTAIWNASFAADTAAGYTSELKSVVLPASLAKINGDPFKNCNQLESVTLMRSKATDGNITSGNVFNGANPPNVTVYVPADSLADYQNSMPNYKDKMQAVAENRNA